MDYVLRINSSNTFRITFISLSSGMEHIERDKDESGISSDGNAYSEGWGVHAYSEGWGVHAYSEGEGVHAYSEGGGVHAYSEGGGVHAYNEGEYMPTMRGSTCLQ